MRKYSLMLLAAAFGLAASEASAADLPRKAPAYVPPPAPPPYVWTGCYIGGNVGGAWSDVSVSNNFTGAEVSRSNGGFAGGGQIGCDYQFAGGWVIGIRNLFDGTSISHTRDIDPLFFNTAFSNPRFETKVQWFDILTGRIGYLAQPNLLFYAQGGAAWAHAQAKFIDDFGEVARSKTSRTGWTAGGGVEWQFVPNWSVFLEYNYLGFQRDSGFTCGPVFCGNDVFTAKANIQTVLVGVNYRFGGIGKGKAPYY